MGRSRSGFCRQMGHAPGRDAHNQEYITRGRASEAPRLAGARPGRAIAGGRQRAARSVVLGH